MNTWKLDYKITFPFLFRRASSMLMRLGLDYLIFTFDRAISPKQLRGYWVTQILSVRRFCRFRENMIFLILNQYWGFLPKRIMAPPLQVPISDSVDSGVARNYLRKVSSLAGVLNCRCIKFINCQSCIFCSPSKNMCSYKIDYNVRKTFGGTDPVKTLKLFLIR